MPIDEQNPALILQGRYDWVTPLAGAVEMAEKLPHAQLHMFENSGHMVFMEEPEELVTVLKEWITSTASQRNWRKNLRLGWPRPLRKKEEHEHQTSYS